MEESLFQAVTHWESKNYPPGVGLEKHLFHGQGICPHFELILKAAQLIGISKEELIKQPDGFCGRHFKMGSHEIGDEGPRAMCQTIAMKLGQLIQTATPAAKAPIKVEPNGKIKIVIKCNRGELDKELQKYLDRSKGEAPLEKLRQGLLSIEGETWFDRSEREVIVAAKKIEAQLCRKTLGVTMQTLWQVPGEKHCKQWPDDDYRFEIHE